MNGQTIRTITIRGTSEGLDKLTADLGKLAAAEQNVAVVSEQTAKRVLSLEEAWKRQTLRLDEGARAQANIARETKVADNALRQGLATQQEHAQRIEQINQRYNTASQSTQKFTQQTGLARHELINLGRQAQDVAVSLAGGQGFGTVMLQQGSQIADVFVSSGKSVGSFFTQAVGWAGRFAASTAGVATGIGAIAAGGLLLASNWQEGQREIDRALLGIGARAGTTRGQINQMAQDNAAGARLSVSEWASAAAEFARTGNIAKENFKGLGDLVKGFAVTTGESTDEAAKKLAQMFSGDAMQAANGLNAIYGSISGKTREYANDLDIAGQRQQAFAVLIREATSGIQQATQITGFWATSWDAVATAAKNAGSSISQALSAMTGVGDTPEAQLQRLQVQLANAEKALAQLRQEAAQLGPELVPGLKIAEQGTESLRERVAALRQQLGKVDESNALRKMGTDADDAVKKLLPHIQQLDEINKLQRQIREGQTPGSGAGLGDRFQEAMNAAEVLKDKIKQVADETARANANGLQLKETYQTSTIEAARTLDALKDQANVAAAVGGAARMEAQEQARYNQLIREGKDAQDASRIAAAERLVTQNQINSSAAETLAGLQDQAAAAGAVGGAARIAAEGAATYNNLIRQGVDASLAAAVAGQQMANAQAQINARAQETLIKLQNQRDVSEALTGSERIRAQAMATYKNLLLDGVNAQIAMNIAVEQEKQARAQVSVQVKEQAFQLNQQAEILEARDQATKSALKAEHAYVNAIRSGASAGAAMELSAAVERVEAAQAEATEEAEKYNRTIQNSTSLVESHRIALDGVAYSWSQISDYAQSYQFSLSGMVDPNKNKFNPAGYESTYDPLMVGISKRQAEQMYGAGNVEEVRDILGGIIGYREKFDWAPKLIDKLQANTDATRENTQTMTDVLSPFYSSDPRSTHLGFRAFAGGGIMTQYGELPLRQYQGGGVASSPQVAVYGEGSTAEAYVPVPSGKIPVEIRQPANSNRPINVTINVSGDADANTVAALKSTAFQQAQSMRRAMMS